MDLMDSILTSASANEYSENFNYYKLTPGILKLLTDEDLKIIGIREESVRKSLLKVIKSLYIPTEKQIDTNVDIDYCSQILSKTTNQLILHNANLMQAINRDDILNYNVQLVPLVNCLLNCVDNLQEQVDELEKQVCVKKKGSNKTFNFMIFISSALVFIFCTVKVFK